MICDAGRLDDIRGEERNGEDMESIGWSGTEMRRISDATRGAEMI